MHLTAALQGPVLPHSGVREGQTLLLPRETPRTHTPTGKAWLVMPEATGEAALQDGSKENLRGPRPLQQEGIRESSQTQRS